MVNPIGSKPLSPPRAASVTVDPVARVRSAESGAERAATGAAASSLQATAREMAASPPVDADRVARIRKAIKDGTFPILPATIADHLLAIKYQWDSHDAA